MEVTRCNFPVAQFVATPSPWGTLAAREADAGLPRLLGHPALEIL